MGVFFEGILRGGIFRGEFDDEEFSAGEFPKEEFFQHLKTENTKLASQRIIKRNDTLIHGGLQIFCLLV